MSMEWADCPEAAGPQSELPALSGGSALDVQGLAQGSLRLPQLDQLALHQNVYIPAAGPDPYRDPARIAREREQAALRDEDPTAALRKLMEASARRAGSDPFTARRAVEGVLAWLAPPRAAPAPEAAAELVPEPAPVTTRKAGKR
jgi:hypothetical protein